ncbi:RES domain-containing protein [Hoeflea sp. IMCC20628]|uniref:RES family NAD+ phosphorylase n=1 Tax=Hoeflea sp. IMCC20628 TaxID=1620421 RepID=UPI00063BD37F|nr:RES family NAD+ phosphorylase [Hoeflea sp. IMCC20628]AKI01454.1 RES domain-containing protein [Hoeflea sp. IMCC20628]
MTLPLATLALSATVRLIPTAYYKPPVLTPLVNDAEDLAVLEALEGLTSQRLIAEKTGLADLDPRELLFRAWGQTHVNAAFAYTRSEGNRFNDAARGAWYSGFDDLTAIAEVANHRSRELEHINHFHDEAIYQALLAGLMGDFHDLRSAPLGTPCLSPDIAVAYPAGQALARAMRGQGSRGFVYRSARRMGGTCLVAFEPHSVQNVRPGARWKMIWNGTRDYTVTTE